jgi:NAD(P)H-dependent flavin oxidoreductase YrpB (nitropropane dioxygenase family)
MSGFEIFAATPPPYLVDGKRHFSKSRPRRNSSWTNIALAAARAGYAGILDLQLMRTGASERWNRTLEEIRICFADEYGGRLGLKYQASQIPAMEAILLPAGETQRAKGTTKVKSSSAQSVPQIVPDFVIVSPMSENRLLSLRAQSFKEHAEKLRAANIRLFVEVFNLAEAQAAENASAYGVIAKGSEAEGQVGDLTTFVLLQQLTGTISLPVIAHGGIGLHTAAACYGAGAQGVVLTSQLLLAQEAENGAIRRQ